MNVICVWYLLAAISVLAYPDQHSFSLLEDSTNDLNLLAFLDSIRLADADSVCPERSWLAL